jgi:hypothetical protein
MGYYIANQGVRQGPFELADLPRYGLRANSMIWTEGMADWQLAISLPQVACLLAPPADSQTPAPTLAYQTPATASNGMAVASLVLGIIAVPFSCHPLLGLVPGILAIVFGFVARGNIKRGETTAGKGMATAGIICGFVPIALLAALILIGLGIAIVAIMQHLHHP